MQTAPPLSVFVKTAVANALKMQNFTPADSSFTRSPLLGGLLLSYLGALYTLGEVRSDNIHLALLLVILYYWNRSSRRLMWFLFPLALTGMVYDSMRFYINDIRSRIHVSEPYLIEKAWFGVTTGANGTVETLNEFFQRHTHPILDFLCGIGYLFFIVVYALFCIYFFGANMKSEAKRATWAFFVVNILGYITYIIYAAAPPWYVELYGLGPVDLTVASNPAGAARFDQLLGVTIFAKMYAKSANVFGAIPSLHVSYPFLGFLFSLKVKRFRAFAGLFSLLVCFAAVYLNHHYVLDVVIGLSYATLSYFIVQKYVN